jgi:hypothetical protein
MSRRIRRYAGFASLVLTAASLSVPAGPAGAAVASCAAGKLVTSPSFDTFDNLLGIAVVSPRDAWAVGRYIIPSTTGSPNRALVEHWNGSRWQLVTVPQPKANKTLLDGITAVSATDIWAVGYTLNAHDEDQHTLIEHFDGTSWSIEPGSVPGILSGVSAGTAGDVWAVGVIPATISTLAKTLTEHWDGTRWQVVPSPSPGKFGDSLGAVTVAAPGDVWAAGDAITSRFDSSVAFTEHWNGTAWSTVPTPAPVSSTDSELRAVAATGGNDVWAAGLYQVPSPQGTLSFTLTEHWTGSRWTIVSSPSPTGDDLFSSLAAVSPSDVWAVGGSGTGSLIANWTGHAWVQEPAPRLHHAVGGIDSVSAASATDVWAAGSDISLRDYSYHTVIENICPG